MSEDEIVKSAAALLVRSGLIDLKTAPIEGWTSLVRKGDNQVFKTVSSSGDPIVIRVLNKDGAAENGASRFEADHQTIAAARGVAPKLLFSDVENGIYVSEFVDGETLERKTLRNEPAISAAMRALRTLHQTETSFSFNYNILDGIRSREDQHATALKARENNNLPKIAVYRKTAIRSRHLLEKTPIKMVPCHTDLVAHNLIRQPNGDVQIIDWEFAGMNDPHQDLGNLFWSARFSEDHIKLALDAYFGRGEEVARARALLWTFLIPYDWLARHEAKIARARGSDKPIDSFVDYQTWRYQEMAKIASFDIFDAAMDTLDAAILERSGQTQDNLAAYDNQLTAVITFKNEGSEVRTTVDEIHRTCGDAVHIHLIDDASDDGYDYQAVSDDYGCRLDRFGVSRGPSMNRHLAAMEATTPYVLFLDAHMRFYENNWHKVMIDTIRKDPESIYSTISKPLDAEGRPKDTAQGYGAYVAFDHEEISKSFRPIWNNKPLDHTETPMIPCILGATYCFDTKFYKKIHGYYGLKHYGGEEPFISIKAWRAGGRCRLINAITIGHIYRTAEERPWSPELNAFWRTRLVYHALLFPLDDYHAWRKKITEELGYPKAPEMFDEDADEIWEERDALAKIFPNNLAYFKALNEAFQQRGNLESWFESEQTGVSAD